MAIGPRPAALAIVEALLKAGADPNVQGMPDIVGTPLEICATVRDLPDDVAAAMATRLIQHGARPSAEAFDLAIDRDRPMLRAVLERAISGETLGD